MVRISGRIDPHFFVYVHKHLLVDKCVYDMNAIKQEGPCQNTQGHSLGVPLRPRARILWSRWLYGRPMWDQHDCEDPDEDLRSIAEIHSWYTDQADNDHFDAGFNASLDAIRNILVNDAHVPREPISVLLRPLGEQTKGREMLLELLVYGNCATEGRTRDWLDGLDHRHFDMHFSFVNDVSLEFAAKAARLDPPNPMARCAYHYHRHQDCEGTLV